MIHSKRSYEGLVTIDHRNSPGLTEPMVQQDGTLSPLVGKGQLYESATVTCAHCQVVVILNPLRTRPRHYCAKCDEYTCDGCATLECTPFQKVLDTLMEKDVRRITEL